MYLENLNDINDIKKLNIKQLKVLSEEIRELICSSVEQNGGHLASNLGVVELTTALYYVFDMASDKIVFDVGHQSYAHKILSGRREGFGSLRQMGGISGFPDRKESDFDAVSSGHTSTSLSLSLGLCTGRDLNDEHYNVINVIGDGALTGGQCYEALNNIGIAKTGLIMVLNDNEMSISKNVGIFAKNMSKIRLSKVYGNFKTNFEKFLRKIPLIGKPVAKFLSFLKSIIKAIFTPNVIFEHYNVKYYGPVDGHNLKKLIKIFKKVKDIDEPVMIHVHTKKGKGNCYAEDFPDIYHGVKSGNVYKNSVFSENTGKELLNLARDDNKVVAITAAMADGTGLTEFSRELPKQFFDVGIAEPHAVTFAAGLADTGFKPYFCVYSAFLQRAFDQLSTDICINSLAVTFLIDRSGLVGSDGKTHHGLFDLSLLTCLPNMTIACPASLKELKALIEFSHSFNKPLAIRYSNSYSEKFETDCRFKFPEWDYLDGENSNIIIASGNRMLDLAVKVKDYLSKSGVSCGVINARFIKPLDEKMLKSISNSKIAVLEDNILHGGLASRIVDFYNRENIRVNIKAFGIYDRYVEHGTIDELLKLSGLDIKNIGKYFLN